MDIDNNLDKPILSGSDENMDKKTGIDEDKLNIPNLTNNQDVNNDRINNLKMALKSSKQFLACPFCNHQGDTEVEKKCNILNTVFCVFTGGIFWGCHQFFRNKDCNCFDARHTCNSCGQEMNDYKAC